MNEPADLFRLYSERECGEDGYPRNWHWPHQGQELDGEGYPVVIPAVKDAVRENAGNRCIRCHHPYSKGDGEWSPCGLDCLHMGLVRLRELHRASAWRVHDLTMQGVMAKDAIVDEGPDARMMERFEVEAHWRILTVHHLLVGEEHKRNLKWWNLVSLCQRCHLRIQRKVDLIRPWPYAHSVWFQPYAAGWYAWRYLAEDLSREETMERLEELLALEHRGEPLWT